MRTAIRYDQALYLVIGSVLVLLLIVLMALAIIRFNSGGLGGIEPFITIGLAVLTGIFAAKFLDRAFDTQGVVVVGMEGIKDRRITDIPVPWGAIVKAVPLPKSRRVIIHVGDAEKYLLRKPGRARSLAYAISGSNRSGGQKLDIDTLQLQISPAGLVALMERYSKQTLTKA